MESSPLSEKSSLLMTTSQSLGLWRRRYHNSYKCINSKAALITLLWSFTVNFIYKIFFQPSNYYFGVALSPYELFVFYGGKAFAFCFFPLAGFLADIKYSRHKTIIRSFIALVVSFSICFISSIVITPPAYYELFKHDVDLNIILILMMLSLFVVFIFVLFTIPVIIFNANIIQFGIDQLRDSPGEHQSLFIFWYFWTYYVAALICQLGWNMTFDSLNSSPLLFSGVGILICSSAVVILLSSISLAISRCGKRWFFVDRGRVNPYKLVHRVTKFAHQHKVPIHRSAFTYCEDDIPSGLNLGKSKYGGPFTTEEVEDVKAFYGILKILFACGFAFLPNMASDALLVFFARHVTPQRDYYQNGTIIWNNYVKILFFQNGLLSPLLAVFGIPIYIFLIRPFMYSFHSGLLKRIGLGIIFMLMSITYTAILDTIVHSFKNRSIMCMFEGVDEINSIKYLDLLYLLPPRFLSILSNVLIFTGLYEFICAQSPHSMKGLLIGLSFAARGLFEVLATASIFPFIFSSSFPNCGMLYYYVTIAIGLVAFAVFVHVAKKYKFRERDEPCHVRRFVEEYYSRIQEESGYDYYY